MLSISGGRRGRLVPTLCIVGLVVFYLIVQEYLVSQEKYVIKSHSYTRQQTVNHVGRHLLAYHANCTPRAIENFPDDFMTLEQKQSGGIVVHIIISIYIFSCLAIVCDDFFVPALEKICEVLGLENDVAGATFMAAGSSAPELFTSVIGVFIAKSDVGVGTIVGSAVFNILFITALCGIGAGMVINLKWWPLFRDCIAYSIAISVLILFIYDEEIAWYEAMVMLILYISYITFMAFNRTIEAVVQPWVEGCLDSCYERCCRSRAAKRFTNETPYFEGSVEETSLLDDTDDPKMQGPSHSQGYGTTQPDEGFHDLAFIDVNNEDYTSPLTWPNTWYKRVYWVLMLPVLLLYFITIPDCRRPGCWQKRIILSFMMSILWIAGLSYVMVWMISIIGDAWNIPDAVMGMTFLALGSSIPDALASLFVARDGLGDMSVSNLIGSNIFDILLCLGLPWFIQTAIYMPGSLVYISTVGLTYTAISLLGTVVFFLVVLIINKWKLNMKLGFVLLVAYVAVVTVSCMYELNLFGPINPPQCPRQP